MENNEIRWEKKFRNFEKAYNMFARIADINNPSEAERMGLIQAFEIVFELSWKVLQDYLRAEGYLTKGPKDILKRAFQSGIVQDGHVWQDALDSRNTTVHTYDESKAEKLVCDIHEKYFSAIRDLYFYLKKETEEQ